jgi:RNA polymerase sigma factor (sigma-70 family)
MDSEDDPMPAVVEPGDVPGGLPRPLPPSPSTGSQLRADSSATDRDVQSGHVDALFRRHARALHRFFLRRTGGDHARADDLVQDVFLSVASGSAGETSSALLFTVADRRLVDDLRRSKRRPETVPLTDLFAGRLVARPEGDPSLASALNAAIGALSDSQRRVFVWKVMEGVPFAEIARRLGTSEGAARMQLVRALRAVRADLESRGITP